MRRLILPALLATLAFSPPAHAAGGHTNTQIIRDCLLDGTIDGHYSLAELRKAQAHLPTDVDEYSDCRDVLSRAIAAKTQAAAPPSGGSTPPAAGGASAPPPGGSTPPAAGAPVAPSTPADQQALDQATRDGAGPVAVGGRTIAPGSASLVSAAGENPLPHSMVAVLVLLGAALLAAILPFLRRHGRPRPPA
jgi:hypothetical protein